MYTTARLLASINVEALARFEGFDVRFDYPEPSPLTLPLTLP